MDMHLEGGHNVDIFTPPELKFNLREYSAAELQNLAELEAETDSNSSPTPNPFLDLKRFKAPMREYLDLKNRAPIYRNQTPINLYICVCSLISPKSNSFIQFCHKSDFKRLLLFLILSAKYIPTLLR